MKKPLRIILWIILILVLIVLVFLGTLTATEYKPDDVEEVEVYGESHRDAVPLNESIKIVSWNVGYYALGKDADFIMDGGGNAPAADKATVQANIAGIKQTLDKSIADIYMMQEVDTDSSRSYHIDARDDFNIGMNAHALNYSCPFVPYPWPPMGKVNSGLFTTTAYEIDEAERISLPCPFSWPLRIANLKRCLLVSYLPVSGSDKELVIVNLHLEAYDDGEGKLAQTKQLKEFIQSEYEKGNYVIAGGDFNQIFPGGMDEYPNTHQDLWTPGLLDETCIPDGWSFAYDLSTPSCRLLNQPYNPEDTENTQYYVIDGFILSPNVELETVETQDAGFEYSDHNPVFLTVKLTNG